MPLILDPQTEQRIHEEVERGHYETVDDLNNHAIDALHGFGFTLPEERAEVQGRLEVAWHELQRGEGIAGSRIEELSSRPYPASGNQISKFPLVIQSSG